MIILQGAFPVASTDREAGRPAFPREECIDGATCPSVAVFGLLHTAKFFFL
jgi:hypothetical protein